MPAASAAGYCGQDPVAPGTDPETAVKLPQGVPIVLTYLTAHVERRQSDLLPTISTAGIRRHRRRSLKQLAADLSSGSRSAALILARSTKENRPGRCARTGISLPVRPLKPRSGAGGGGGGGGGGAGHVSVAGITEPSGHVCVAGGGGGGGGAAEAAAAAEAPRSCRSRSPAGCASGTGRRSVNGVPSEAVRKLQVATLKKRNFRPTSMFGLTA